MAKRLKISLATLLLAMVAAPVQAGDPPGPYHKNDRWGFKVKSPNGWLTVAMSANEKWVAAKFLGPKDLKPKNAGQNYYWGEKPDMWVIGFPHSRMGNRKAEIKTGKFGRKDFKTTQTYRDYKDFMEKERIARGGYHFTREEEIEVNGGKVSIYEALVKGAGTRGGNKRVLTWVYHFDDIDFAVQFRILDDYYKNYLKGFRGCLKSLKRVKRTKALPGAETTGRKIKDSTDETEMTAEEKKQTRKEEIEGRINREKDVLGKGWYTIRSKNYVAFSNTDRKFAKRTLDHCEAIRGYLDKTFGEVGGDYVPPGIVRIFASRAEETAYSQGSSSLWTDLRPVLVTKSHGANKRWEYEYVSRRIAAQWLQYKNAHLAASIPHWLSEGLEQHMAMARSKGKRVEIKPDAWDRESIKRLIKSGKAVPMKKLFLEDTEGINFRWGDHNMQAGSVVGFLLTKGNRGKFKGALRNYLQGLILAIQNAEAEMKSKLDKARADLEAAEAEAAGSEEEEDENEEENEEASASEEYGQAIMDAFKARRKQIIEDSFKATFGKITDKQWAKLDRAWADWAG